MTTATREPVVIRLAEAAERKSRKWMEEFRLAIDRELFETGDPTTDAKLEKLLSERNVTREEFGRYVSVARERLEQGWDKFQADAESNLEAINAEMVEAGREEKHILNVLLPAARRRSQAAGGRYSLHMATVAQIGAFTSANPMLYGADLAAAAEQMRPAVSVEEAVRARGDHVFPVNHSIEARRDG